MLTIHNKYAITYNKNARLNIQALLLDTSEHLILQGTNLVQDVHNLDQRISKNMSLKR
jgi:hypothetical protein